MIARSTRAFPTLTPGQFRRLKRIMRRETVAPGTPLTLEGKPVDDLMLVYAERIEIEKAGATFPIAGPAFVGEIALLTGNVSSASVHCPRAARWCASRWTTLKARMARAPSLSNAMVALFGQETGAQGCRQRADGPRRHVPPAVGGRCQPRRRGRTAERPGAPGSAGGGSSPC
jgi:CRP-like cAMP-binding protein